jgi:hypothetical protein
MGYGMSDCGIAGPRCSGEDGKAGVQRGEEDGEVPGKQADDDEMKPEKSEPLEEAGAVRDADEAAEDDDGTPPWEQVGECEREASSMYCTRDRGRFQEELSPSDTTLARWYIVCRELDDWKQLTRTFRNAVSRNERALYAILKNEFLGSIEEIYEQVREGDFG